MSKKGVEMSLNVIIVAAIGLLILVILAFLVINYVGSVQKGLESCNTKGGSCEAVCTNPMDQPASGKPWDCTQRTDTKKTCCKILVGQ